MQTAPVEFENAIKANTKLIYVETPCNPTLALTDLKSIAFIGKKHGLLTVVDNTFASPFNQRPLEFGIDIVVHSATKYLAGHSDVVAGAVCGSRAHVERLWPTHVMLGGCLHPNEAWLLCRGIKTFALRMRQINTNGLAVARWLQDQPAVERVHYPWLLSHPQHDLAVAQMKGGRLVGESVTFFFFFFFCLEPH